MLNRLYMPPKFTEKGIKITAVDNGKGISNLDEIMSGNYKSSTGMGQGLIAVKKLMDFFQINTSPESGTAITIAKWL